jgi:hypothetical protein
VCDRGPLSTRAASLFGAENCVFQAAAGLWLTDKVGFDVDAAIGGRYWF